jgi:hypothetical protein
MMNVFSAARFNFFPPCVCVEPSTEPSLFFLKEREKTLEACLINWLICYELSLSLPPPLIRFSCTFVDFGFSTQTQQARTFNLFAHEINNFHSFSSSSQLIFPMVRESAVELGKRGENESSSLSRITEIKFFLVTLRRFSPAFVINLLEFICGERLAVSCICRYQLNIPYNHMPNARLTLEEKFL